MPRLVLVRHGEATGGWHTDVDPGLSERGQAQAAAMAAAIGDVRPIVVSPLRRTRETAATLEARWNTVAQVEPAVGEIPSPTDDLVERTAWLMQAMRGSWPDLDAPFQTWHARLLEALLAIDRDTVVVTHFIAINAAVGAATGNESVVSFRPANCSQTTIEHDGRAIHVVELGSEAETRVL